MKFLPVNIKNQTFTKTVRGYDTEEVQSYLETLAREVQTLINEDVKLKAEIENLNQKVNDYQTKATEQQDTLAKLQDASAKTLESAKTQSGLMLQEAELKASQIVESANKKAEELKMAHEFLKEEKNLIISKLRAIVNSQANLLEGKVKQAGEEAVKKKKSGKSEDVNIDVDDIVNKLL